MPDFWCELFFLTHRMTDKRYNKLNQIIRCPTTCMSDLRVCTVLTGRVRPSITVLQCCEVHIWGGGGSFLDGKRSQVITGTQGRACGLELRRKPATAVFVCLLCCWAASRSVIHSLWVIWMLHWKDEHIFAPTPNIYELNVKEKQGDANFWLAFKNTSLHLSVGCFLSQPIRSLLWWGWVPKMFSLEAHSWALMVGHGLQHRPLYCIVKMQNGTRNFLDLSPMLSVTRDALLWRLLHILRAFFFPHKIRQQKSIIRITM